MVEGVGADGSDTAADGERGQLLTADEGILADRGDAVLDGDAGQVVAPRSIGAPEVVNGFVAVFVRHRPAAADGQFGVLTVLLAERPVGIVAALATDGAECYLKAIESSICGEGDRIFRTGLRIGAAHHAAAVLEHHIGNGDAVRGFKSERRGARGMDAHGCNA